MAVIFHPVYGPVNWLTVSPLSGTRAISTAAPLSLTVNTAGLSVGNYTAWLLMQTNAPYSLYRIVPVQLRVTASPPPTVNKTVSNLSPVSGERIAYTVRVDNPGASLTETVISDPLPTGVLFAGPATLSGGTGTLGTPPNLVTHLMILAGAASRSPIR